MRRPPMPRGPMPKLPPPLPRRFLLPFRDDDTHSSDPFPGRGGGGGRGRRPYDIVALARRSVERVTITHGSTTGGKSKEDFGEKAVGCGRAATEATEPCLTRHLPLGRNTPGNSPGNGECSVGSAVWGVQGRAAGAKGIRDRMESVGPDNGSALAPSQDDEVAAEGDAAEVARYSQQLLTEGHE
ncbi:hypothetical protein THAOC_10651, partial [Thalassiosira oceanica]